MSNRPPLSQEEKERIYLGKLEGQTLPELAAEIGCSLECARKWWRVGRDKGLEGLRAPRRGRGCTGILSQFDPRVAEQALDYKRAHRRWGADRVLIELAQHPELKGVALPKHSRLAAFFKERCPECVAQRKPRAEPVQRLPDATGVHEIWQLDCQEKMLLNQVEDQIQVMQQEVDEVFRLREEVERKQEELAVLRGIMTGRQTVLTVLEELSERVPEDSYFRTFKVSGGEVEIQGTGTRASSLVPILSESPYLDSVKINWIRADSRDEGKERFSFSATIEGTGEGNEGSAE